MKYRKKPVVIEAVRYLGEKNISEIRFFVNDGSLKYNPDNYECCIKTLEGDMMCSFGDYIIKGTKGEFYPCTPDIFEQTYEEVIDFIYS